MQYSPYAKISVTSLVCIDIGGSVACVVRALDLSGDPGFKFSSLPLDEFVFGGQLLHAL